MKLGYELTIEQSQKLVMTPELIQAIKILQFNTQELDSYISEQLLTNPVLESTVSETEENKRKREKEELIKEYAKRQEYEGTNYRQRDYSKEDEDKSHLYEQQAKTEVTLPEHLMFQLQFASDKTKCRQVGRYIIESLDDNGYMTATEEEIATATETDISSVKKVLSLIQSFEPFGVGTYDLKQCLLVQLEQRGKSNKHFEKVLSDHLEDLAANRLNVIAKKLGISVEEVQKMADTIKTLDPKPGRAFATQDKTRYIIPDIYVEVVDGEYIITTNERNIPRLMVSSYYKKVLNESEEDSKLSDYLSERLNSAVWLIKSIEQRKQTILNVVKGIVDFQIDFFEKGDKYLKTLTLKQIADELGIHESTVSRSINGKYMQSPRGVFELKYFFSAGVSGNQGEGISSNSIKTHIKEIISSENPKSPYSDQALVKLLGDRGIEISRRTVAKYRDEMNILSSSKRKRY